MPLPEPSQAGLTKSGKGSAHAAASATDSARRNGAVGTPRATMMSLARPLWSARPSASGSEAWQGMPKNSQMAGTWPSRFGP